MLPPARPWPRRWQRCNSTLNSLQKEECKCPSGALYLWRGWSWIDPVVSLAIALVIVIGTWSLFRRSLHLLFDGVPEQVDLPAVRQFLLGQIGVCDVYDLHVWAMSTAEVALPAHMRMAPLPDDDRFLLTTCEELREHFGIAHSTLQLEHDAGCKQGCSLPKARHRFRCLLADIDAGIRHDGDGMGVDPSRLGAGAHHLDLWPQQLARQAFGHLAAG